MAGCLSAFSPNSLKPPSNLSFELVWSTFFRWVQTRIRTGFFGVLRVKCTKRRWFLSSGNVLQFPLRSANCCETVKTRNLVGRATGARVQIPAAPPNRGNRWTFRSSVPSFFIWSILPGAASSAGKPLRLVFRHTKMDDDGRINRVLAPVDACRPKQYNRSKWNPIGQSRKG